MTSRSAFTKGLVVGVDRGGGGGSKYEYTLLERLVFEHAPLLKGERVWK